VLLRLVWWCASVVLARDLFLTPDGKATCMLFPTDWDLLAHNINAALKTLNTRWVVWGLRSAPPCPSTPHPPVQQRCNPPSPRVPWRARRAGPRSFTSVPAVRTTLAIPTPPAPRAALPRWTPLASPYVCHVPVSLDSVVGWWERRVSVAWLHVPIWAAVTAALPPPRPLPLHTPAVHRCVCVRQSTFPHQHTLYPATKCNVPPPGAARDLHRSRWWCWRGGCDPRPCSSSPSSPCWCPC
jgi:hypothetical protein